MTPVEVKRIVGGLPSMTLEQGEAMTRFIGEQGIGDILELGFHHGVSTCYMAAALAGRGGGSITTIDLEAARAAAPNVEALLERVGERGRVRVHYEPSSYAWRLMRFLEEDPAPRFDLCYLDGAHTWRDDALAFFLADRLLRPGGWIVLDDLDWTFAASPSLKDAGWVRALPADERTEPQVRKIYELLVKPHPGYHNFVVRDGWAYAQKRAGLPRAARDVVTEVRVERVHVGLGGLAVRAARLLLGRRA